MQSGYSGETESCWGGRDGNGERWDTGQGDWWPEDSGEGHGGRSRSRRLV